MSTLIYPESFILDTVTHPKKEYDPSLRLPTNQHLGQLKLFSNELLFILNHVYISSKDIKRNKLIIYIGAGPGYHLITLIKMFPKIEWHLYDTRLIKELRMDNVKLFERYFEDSDMETYSNIDPDKKDVYLISDIRDLSYNPKLQNIEEEMKIFNDMDLQMKWAKGVQGVYTMVKFRPPFPEKHVLDYLKHDYIEYFPGIIYKQPWSKITSVETRLVVKREDLTKVKKYYLKEYESMMFYHNSIYRGKKYIFPLSTILTNVKITPKVKITDYYDFAFTITVLYYYMLRINIKDDNVISKSIIKVLSKLICQ